MSELAELVQSEVELAASIDDVWAAITRAERLSEWFGAEVELDARVDAPVSFRWPDGSLRRGLVEAVEPPRLFAFRWRVVQADAFGFRVGEASRVEFRLEKTLSGGTRVLVVENPGIVAPDTAEARA